MSNLVFEDEHCQAIFRPGSTDYVLITFSEMAMRADGKGYWAKSFCDKADITTLGIVARTPNWFPAGSIGRVAEVSRSILEKWESVVTYGYSIGGYGALKWAAPFGARTAIAVSPQFSISPKTMGQRDARYSAYHVPHLHADMDIRPSDIPGRAFVIFDPLDLFDNVNIEFLRKDLGFVSEIPIHATGHQTIRVLARTEVAKGLIASARRNNRNELLGIARDARRASPFRLISILRVMGRRKTRTAFEFYGKVAKSLTVPQRISVLNEMAKWRMIEEPTLSVNILREVLMMDPSNIEANRRVELVNSRQFQSGPKPV